MQFAEKKGRGTVIPLGRTLLHGSSDLPGSCDAPSQHVPAGSPNPCALHGAGETGGILPYLVLLRVGFSLPPPSLAARCALTAPFHPYLAQFAQVAMTPRRTNWAGRYVFCGTFRQRRLNGAARTLSGTLLSEVRTFLCPPAQPDLAEASAKRNDQCSPAGSDRPAQQLTMQL
jgi:hypothetical protein